MAVDASIPLSGIAPPIMGPSQQLQLRDLAMKMEDDRKARQVQAAVLQLNQMPGMRSASGIPTDQYIMQLSKISPQLADVTVQHRATLMAQENLAAYRKSEEDRERNKAGEEKRKEVLKGALSVYYSTPGSEDQKQSAFKKSISDSVEEMRKSGGGTRYGWDESKLDHMGRSFPSVADAEGFVLSPKDVIERADTKAAAAVAGGGASPSGTMPLKEVGKEGPKDVVTGQPIPESVDPKSGAVVRGIDQTQPQGEAIGQNEQDPRPGEQTYKSEITPEGVKVEDTAVTAKPYRGDTVEGLRQQAQAKEGQAAQLRMLGTKAGNTQAKEAEQQADKLRSAAVALETRDQKDTDQELAGKRLQLAVDKASKTQEPLDPETAALLGEAVAKGNYALASGLARNQTAQMQVKKAMGKYAQEHGMSATDLNVAHANFSGAMQENRTLGGRAAQMAIPVNEMKQFIPMAESAINKVPRTQFLPLNRLIEMYQTGTTSPEQRDLILAVQGVRNAYAQVVSRGGISVHSQELSEHALESADSPQAFKAALRRMWAEAEGGRKAINQSQKEAGGSIRGEEFKMDPYPGETEKKGGTYVKEKKLAPLQYEDPEKEKRYQEWKQQNAK